VLVELIALAFGSFILALSGALVPGPMFAATLAGSHRDGFWFGPRVVLGHALAELAVVALLFAGLALFMKNVRVVIVIAAVGSAALVWMGVGLARQSRRPPDVAEGAAFLRFGAAATGLITSVLNPYWYLWWVTMPALLMTAAREMGWMGVAAFFLGHISADFAWYSLASFSISRGRRLLQGRLYKGLLIACAVILFVMAGLFLKLAVEKAATGGLESP